MEIKIGGQVVSQQTTHNSRLSMLLWGPSGSGKTTLAETAPGPRLLLNWDPDGHESLQRHEGNNETIVLDFSVKPDKSVRDWIDKDTGAVRDLRKLLTDRPEIKSVIFDSLTTFGDKCLTYGVTYGLSTKKGKNEDISQENPGYTGFGNKNTWMYSTVRALLEMTAELQRHMIFVCHENAGDKDDKGIIRSYTLMLGSNLVQQVPVRISEIWHVSDTGKERRIAFRPCRLRSPMRTRMFVTNQSPEFVWKYDAEKNSGEHTLAQFYDKWKDNGFRKLPVPK